MLRQGLETILLRFSNNSGKVLEPAWVKGPARPSRPCHPEG
jgi:hypothetical protein